MTILQAACFRLGMAGSQITQAFSQRVERLGLTHKQVGLLAAVDAGHASSQRDIATRLNVAPSLVVSLVDQLAGTGHHPHPERAGAVGGKRRGGRGARRRIARPPLPCRPQSARYGTRGVGAFRLTPRQTATTIRQPTFAPRRTQTTDQRSRRQLDGRRQRLGSQPQRLNGRRKEAQGRRKEAPSQPESAATAGKAGQQQESGADTKKRQGQTQRRGKARGEEQARPSANAEKHAYF